MRAAGLGLGGRAREADLARLVAMLPGVYDNAAQVEADRAAGRSAAAALRLHVVRIYAPFIAEQVFYVHEAALDDERRVFSQRLWALDIGPDKTLRQRTLTLREPQRWREGHLEPDLFKALMRQDVIADAPGCDIRWRREAARFIGRADPAACRRASSQGGAPLRVEERRELDDAGLALATLSWDEAQRPVEVRGDDPFLRLRRR